MNVCKCTDGPEIPGGVFSSSWDGSCRRCGRLVELELEPAELVAEHKGFPYTMKPGPWVSLSRNRLGPA